MGVVGTHKGVEENAIKLPIKRCDHVLPASKQDGDPFLLVPAICQHPSVYRGVGFDNSVRSWANVLNETVNDTHSKSHVQDVAHSLADHLSVCLHQRSLPFHHHPTAALIQQLVVPFVPSMVARGEYSDCGGGGEGTHRTWRSRYCRLLTSASDATPISRWRAPIARNKSSARTPASTRTSATA